jgi:hypothetical protein
MARISGAGIDPAGLYIATELEGKGLFRLHKQPPVEPALDGSMTIKISREAARKVGRHKLLGESLAAAVERLALAALPVQSRSQSSAKT